MTIEFALDAVRQELEAAKAKHRDMVIFHDGYAVILEELDELWDEVKFWRGSAWKGLTSTDAIALEAKTREKM